jgi:hypothetical protein
LPQEFTSRIACRLAACVGRWSLAFLRKKTIKNQTAHFLFVISRNYLATAVIRFGQRKTFRFRGIFDEL